MIETLKNELEEVKRAARGLKVSSAFINDGSLVSVLTDINTALEQATVTSRNILERLNSNYSMQETNAPELPYLDISGSIKIIEYNWLYIKLNTLLPHCRYQSPAYLIDTISRLLDAQEARAGRLPYYKNAMLIIDEHCNISSRTPFDNDNKNWKAIPNVLKGRVIPDDDQFTLDLVLISKRSENPYCNIFILDAQDADAFFNLRNSGLLFW